MGHTRLFLWNGCSGSILNGSTNVISHSFFDVSLSLVPLPLLWLFLLCCFVGSLYSVCLLNIEHCDTGNKLLKDQGQLS